MTLTLILTRHAKSDWDDPRLDDHDRPLNSRGLASAPVIGAWLRARGHLPRRALVSTATRAVETWEGLASALPEPAPRVTFHRRLYHAPPEVMLSHLGDVSEDPVLMVGHNPGIAALSAALVETVPHHPGFADYPTAATLVVRFDIDRWDMLRRGTGKVLDFVVPRDLME